jgi:hypothetical protein
MDRSHAIFYSQLSRRRYVFWGCATWLGATRYARNGRRHTGMESAMLCPGDLHYGLTPNYRIERRVNDKVPSPSMGARGAHAER